MQALQELFTAYFDLLSIAFMLATGGFYLRYFIQHMQADEAREAARQRAAQPRGAQPRGAR